MKKYITIAALLAAGTACANAAAYTSASEWGLQTALSEIGYQGTGDFSFSFDIASTTYEDAYDSAVILTIGSTVVEEETVPKAALWTQSGRYLGILSPVDGDLSSGWNALGSTAAEPKDYKGALAEAWFRDLGSNGRVDDVSVNVEYNSGDGELILTVGYSNTEQVLTFTGMNGENSLDARDFKLGDKITVANLEVSPVPEPSAFGLLAGIGALALVASRRRRK